MKSVRITSGLLCALCLVTGCAFEGAEAGDEASDGAEAVGQAAQPLSQKFKIKARRAEICLRASWSETPLGGKLIGVKCGTDPDFYFTTDDQRHLITNGGYCVGIVNDGPSGELVIQNCDGDKDQKWTFRSQVERKIDAWHTKWIQFIENDNPGYFVRLPNMTPNTAAVSNTWSRSFYVDYDWAQEYVQ